MDPASQNDHPVTFDAQIKFQKPLVVSDDLEDGNLELRKFDDSNSWVKADLYEFSSA